MEYLQLLWRRKLLILLVAAAMLAATWFIIKRIPNVYEARASVVVGPTESREAVAARVAAISERITSRAFLETIVQHHNLSPSADPAAVEGAVYRLRRNIKVETKYRGDRPETMIVSYRDANPTVAREVATSLISPFGRMNEDIERELAEQSASVGSEISSIEDHIEQINRQKSSVAARRSAASRASGFAIEMRAQRAAASSSVETLTDRQYSLERQIAEQKQQIAEQQKLVKVAPGDARAGSSYGVLLVRKAELEAQIKDYAGQYTDKNPKVIQTRLQLAEVNKQIAALDAGDQSGGVATSAEARELRAMQRELSRMETELEVTRRELNRKKSVLESTPSVSAGATAPAAEAIGASIDGSMDAERLRNRYNSLLNKQDLLGKLRIESAGLSPGLFQIVDVPTQPQSPVGPDRTKLGLLALVLALGAGLVAAMAVEAPRLFAIRDDRDVQYYLGAPVVALIPETLTPAERGRARRLHLARGILAIVLAAILVPIFILVFNSLQVFQILANRW
jgi:uncharacterized protein involved in exopolysaccharide biosynthesis